jgi:hypothetical protein
MSRASLPCAVSAFAGRLIGLLGSIGNLDAPAIDANVVHRNRFRCQRSARLAGTQIKANTMLWTRDVMRTNAAAFQGAILMAAPIVDRKKFITITADQYRFTMALNGFASGFRKLINV